MLKNTDRPERKASLGGTGKGAAEVYYVPIPDKAGAFQMATRIEMEPGATIGYHQHAEDEEVYIVLSGEGIYIEENERVPAKPGDVFLCRKGNSHGLENTGGKPLILAAAIAKK
ncbi:cupin domain-containing protein [Synergistaceae bacterium OttesenSCG-928-D05]|nr:cupin domain-containing protein [Synergistaceae bacterium OttesenSCG-928-D05]